MGGNAQRAGEQDGDAGRQAWPESQGSRGYQAAGAKAQVQVRDAARAQRVIQFIETLTIPSGVGQGGPFILRPWQQDFIRDIYEPIVSETERRRVVRRAILSVARKNGKTALIAALALAHLVGPEQVPNGEIYSAANEREQAAIVFRVAAQMVRAEPELMARLRVVDSTKTIANYSNGSFYRAISAEAGTKHGLNPTVVIYDELAQAKNRNLYDVLDTSMGARLEPLFVTISTQSNDPEHILSKLIDDGLNADDPTTVCHLFAVPEEDDVFDFTVWKKANPALGDFRDLDDFRALAAKAARMPAEEPKFRNLYLNQRVAPVASLIARAEWMECNGAANFQDGESVYLALDLSSTTDLTALVMVSAENGSRVKPFFWKPSDLLKDHSDRDFGSGNNRYSDWASRGHLLTSPGRSISPEVVALCIAELVQRYKVLGLAYDRWRIQDLMREFDRVGLQVYQAGKEGDLQGTYGIAGTSSGLRVVPWGQGYRDMAPAIDALELAVLHRELEHPGNPVLNWNMANAIATMDPAGNRKLDKDKARFRIDGAVALAMGIGLKSRERAEQPLDVMAMIA